MKTITLVRLFFGCLIVIATLAIAIPEAFGSGCREGHRQCGHDDEDSLNQEQQQEQGQGQDQVQGQEQGQGQDQSQEQTATADNAGNTQAVHFSSPQRAPNTYLQLNNNTESCVRVLGFSFANTGGSGMIGVPLPRGKACDIWKAVNEAQENGHIALSYAFMCEIKNIRNVWGLERCQALTDEAMRWLEDTLDAPEPVGALSYPDDYMVAQVSQEEYEEQHELVEYRYAQQQNLIESLQQQAAEDDAEIERLKREAAALREQEEADAARRAKTRELLKDKYDGSESDTE